MARPKPKDAPKRALQPDASPAKLYATAIGGLLVIAGIAGFFYSASFGSPGEVDDAFGRFAVNGWENVLHILTGALGLFLAGFAARRYAFWIGIAYLGIAFWGFVLGDGTQQILGFLPVNGADNFLHLALGLLGVGAALGTTKAGAPREISTPKAAKRRPKPSRPSKKSRPDKPKRPAKPKRPSSQTIN